MHFNESFSVVETSVDRSHKLKSLLALLAIFICSVVVTNVIGVKIMTFLGFSFTAGVITFAASFLCTDTVSEIYGRKTANYFVLLGFVASLFMLLFVQIAIHSEPASFWTGQEAYEETLGAVKRIVLASMVAYLASQFHDVWAFHLWRKVTKGKYLWLRNNLSTFTSQVIDTVLFVSIAFAGTMEFSQLWSIMFAQFMIKWLLAIADTVLIYPLVALLGPPLENAHTAYASTSN